MKTPIQELMDTFAKKADSLPDTLDANVAYLVFQECYDIAKSMLEKEKEVMDKVAGDFWNEGAGYMYDGKRKHKDFEQYYNETFNTEDK